MPLHLPSSSPSPSLRRLFSWLPHPIALAVSAGALLPTLSFGAGAVWYWTGNGNANLQNGPNWANASFVQQTGGVLDFSDGQGTGTANGAGADQLIFPSTETIYTSSTGAPLTFNTTKTAIAINAPGAPNNGTTFHTWQSITFEEGTLGFTIGPLATVPFILGDSTDPLSNPGNTGFIANLSTATQTFNQPVRFRFGGVNADAGPVTFQQAVNVGHDLAAATNNLTIAGSSFVTINGALQGLGDDTSLGGAVIKGGTGTLNLNGINSAWNGRILINDGSVLVGTSTALGSTVGRTTIAGGSNAGRLSFSTPGPAALAVAENLHLEGRVTTNAPQVINLAGETNLTGAIVLDAGGEEYGFRTDAGLLTVAGSVSYGTTTGATNLRLSGAGNGVIASNLGTPGISVVKDGAGTWSLTGANAYTGTTTVNAGQLNIAATQTGGGDFTVNDLATLGVKLSGSGQSLVTSTLTLGAATGGILTLDLGNFASTTVPAVTTSILTTNGTNTVTVAAAGLTVAAYPLIGYSGTIQGDGFAGLALANLPPRVTANLLNDTASKKVLLNITQFDIPRWTGAVNGNWDINNSANPATESGTPNWRELNSGNSTRYLQTAGAVDSVLFDDTASGTPDVVLAANVSPVTLTVKNTLLTYTFSGLGKITGATNVVKQDPGTWIIANTTPNDYTGTTTISGGVVQIGDGFTPGGGSFGAGTVTNNASIVLQRSPGETYSLPTTIGGTGSVTKAGANTAILSGLNSFDGTVTVADGTLTLGSNTALGSTLGGTTVQSGATLDVGDFKTPTGEVVTIGGPGVTSGGALVSSGPVGGVNAGIGSLVLAADATIGGTRRFDVRNGTLAGGGFTLTKVGTNNVFLANLGETQLGGIVLNAGRLTFEGTTTFGAAPGTVEIDVNGELGLENSTAAQTKAVQLNGGKIVFNGGAANTLAGGVTLAPAVTNTVQGPVSAASTLTVSGNVEGGALTKTQAGTLVLAGTNTYVGGTIISAGAVHFSTPAAVPDTGTISLGPGSTVGFGFDFDQSFLTGRVNATPNPATLALGVDSATPLDFASYSGLSLGASATVVYSGALKPAGTSAGGAYRLGGGGGALTYTGTLAGNNPLNIGTGGSSGTVTLTGANSHAGRTTVAGGSTLIIGSASALGLASNPLTVDGTLDLNGFDTIVGGLTAANSGLVTDHSTMPGTTVFTDNIASGSSTFSGTIANGANGRVLSFVKAGAGAVVMNKANGNTYTGGTTLAEGRLDVRTNAAQVLPNGTNLTFTGTATFAPSNNGNGNATLTLGALAFNGGEGVIESNNFNGGTGSQNTVFTAAPTRAAGATGNFIVANATTPTSLPSPATYRVTFTTAPATGQSLDGGLFFGGDNFAAYHSGAGYVRALDYIADSNALNLPLTEDLPAFGSATGRDVQVSGTGFNITNQTTDTIRTLKIASASNVSLNPGATLTISSGGLLKAGASAATIDGGDGLTTDGAGDLVVRTAAATDVLTIATNILASTTGGLTKSGPGTLILSGTDNAFSGGIWVNAGSLRFASLSAMPAASLIRLNTSTSVSFGHAFDQAFLAAHLPVATNSATIALGANNANDLDFSVAGANYPAISLGASGAFTYSGTLTPHSSVYRLGGGGGTLTYAGVLGGDNALVVNGAGSAGTVMLPAANTHTGGTTIVSGTLRLGNAAALGAAGGTVTLTGGTLDLRGFDQVLTNFSGGNGTLTDNTPGSTATTTVTANILSGTRTFSGSINNGTGGRVLNVVKDGAGTLVLSKANGHNYTGGTFINQGRLEIRTNNAQVLPNGSPVTFTGTGTLAATNNGDATVTTAALILGPLNLNAGDAIIESNQLSASTTNTLVFAATPTRAAGATGNFTLTAATDPALYKVVFTSAPASGQSVNGGLFYNYTEFLTYDAGGFARGMRYSGASPDANASDVALTANQLTLGPGLAGKDVQLGGASGASITAQTSETIRSLKIAGAHDLVLGDGETLSIAGGGLLKTGGNSAVISGGAGLTTGGLADLVARVDLATDTLTIATPIQSTTTGGVTKTGQGTLVLGAFNEYSGPTTVNAGTLVLSGSINGSSSVLVNRGATLAGTGTVTTAANGNVTVANGGNLSPGLSAGTLRLQLGAGQLDLGPGASGTGWLKFELGAFSDSIELISGVLNLGTGFDLGAFSFSDSGGFGPGTYTLFDSAVDIIGSLGANTSGSVLGYEATLAFSGGLNDRDDLVLLIGAPIPEPGALLSLLTGALALASRRRRPALRK